jgi:arabinogalactan endo-1,4-beta-galactosidase
MKSSVLLAATAAAALLALTSCPNPTVNGSSGQPLQEEAKYMTAADYTGWADQYTDPPDLGEWRRLVPKHLSITVNRIKGLSPHFMKGVDISMLAQIEACGGTFYQEDGRARDALKILKDHGVNWVRLRIWNNPVFPPGTTSYHGTPVSPGPAGGGNDDETVVRSLAKRARALGMRVYLDFHYSDFWADPGKQDIPAAWKGMTAPQLEQAVYEYTRKVIRDMQSDGGAPDIVEIGNEVNNGILWPIGQIAGAKTDPASYVEFNRLLNKAAKAVRDTSPWSKIMIHIANDAGLSGAQTFFDNVARAVDFDVIGLSYYPYWHGSLADLQTVMNTITARYRKPVIIAEMAYAFTSANADSQSNSWAGTDPMAGGFEVSVQGQATAMREIMEAVSNVPRDRGLGVFYWEPDWIPVPGAGWITGQGDGWENQAWWDFNGKPLESMWTYRLVSESRSHLQATITSIPALAIQTTVGVAPVLPATVWAFFSDASYNQVPVTWAAVDPSQYAATGTFSVTGTVAGTDLTATATISVVEINYAVNGGFETGSLAPWVTSATSGGAAVSAFSVENSSTTGNTHTGSYDGSYWYGSAYTFDVHQTITGLAAGTYKMTAWVMGAGSPISLDIYAENGTKATAAVTNTGWQQWHQYTISGIAVGASGQLVIGFEGDMSAGDWGKLDDVVVTRQ